MYVLPAMISISVLKHDEQLRVTTVGEENPSSEGLGSASSGATTNLRALNLADTGISLLLLPSTAIVHGD